VNKEVYIVNMVNCAGCMETVAC